MAAILSSLVASKDCASRKPSARLRFCDARDDTSQPNGRAEDALNGTHATLARARRLARCLYAGIRQRIVHCSTLLDGGA